MKFFVIFRIFYEFILKQTNIAQHHQFNEHELGQTPGDSERQAGRDLVTKQQRQKYNLKVYHKYFSFALITRFSLKYIPHIIRLPNYDYTVDNNSSSLNKYIQFNLNIYGQNKIGISSLVKDLNVIFV